MTQWTDELKAKVIEMYEGADPTPETSTEIIKDIADEIEARGDKGLDLDPGETAEWLREEANVTKAAKDYHG